MTIGDPIQLDQRLSNIRAVSQGRSTKSSDSTSLAPDQTETPSGIRDKKAAPQ